MFTFGGRPCESVGLHFQRNSEVDIIYSLERASSRHAVYYFLTKKKKNLRAQVHDESERLFVYITIVSAGTQKADHILNNNVTNRRLPTLESNLKKKKKKKDDGKRNFILYSM